MITLNEKHDKCLYIIMSMNQFGLSYKASSLSHENKDSNTTVYLTEE